VPTLYVSAQQVAVARWGTPINGIFCQLPTHVPLDAARPSDGPASCTVDTGASRTHTLTVEILARSPHFVIE
jgi:hypothetical protein